jgi:hypothetical protein
MTSKIIRCFELAKYLGASEKEVKKMWLEV